MLVREIRCSTTGPRGARLAAQRYQRLQNLAGRHTNETADRQARGCVVAVRPSCVSHRAARHGDGCPECGLPLCSEKCWSCRGAASSWAYLCEECGGTSQLLLCPASGTPLSATAQPTGGRTIGTIRRGKPAIHLLQGLSRASLPARTILQHQSQQSRSHPAIRWLLWERELDPWGRAVEQTPVDAPQTLVNRHDPQNGEPHGERCPCHQSSRQS